MAARSSDERGVFEFDGTLRLVLADERVLVRRQHRRLPSERRVLGRPLQVI